MAPAARRLPRRPAGERRPEAAVPGAAQGRVDRGISARVCACTPESGREGHVWGPGAHTAAAPQQLQAHAAAAVHVGSDRALPALQRQGAEGQQGGLGRPTRRCSIRCARAALQDTDGNVFKVAPDQPWPHFLADACCVIVACK